MTITFDEKKVIPLVLSILLTACGLWLSIDGMSANLEGRVWIGGLFCGFGLSAWFAYCIVSTEKR